jgi:hypothetical protein
MIKTGFYGRKSFPGTAKGLNDAIAAWKDIMRKAFAERMQTVESPGINIFKQVEMATKYKDVIPLDNWEDELYIKPDPEAIELVKNKKQRRKAFRVEINADKKKLQKEIDRQEGIHCEEIK